MADIRLDGVKEILDKLQQMGANVGKLENKALKNAAKPVLDDAKSNVPVNTGELKEGLDISNIKKKDGVKYIDVGITKSDNSEIFYGKFIEFGTSKMTARPFLQPAFEKNKNAVKEIIKDILREGLK